MYNLPVLFSGSLIAMSSITKGSDRPFWFTLYATKCKVGACESDGNKSAREKKKENETTQYTLERVVWFFSERLEGSTERTLNQSVVCFKIESSHMENYFPSLVPFPYWGSWCCVCCIAMINFKLKNPTAARARPTL